SGQYGDGTGAARLVLDPGQGNDLVMASVTATCSGYTVSVAWVNGDTPGLSVSFSFTLTPSTGSQIPISDTVPTSAITVGPAPGFDFSGSVTKPWATAFTTNFSFTISGTATFQ